MSPRNQIAEEALALLVPDGPYGYHAEGGDQRPIGGETGSGTTQRVLSYDGGP